MPAPPCGNYGDVTGDGDVTITDAMYISQYLIGSRTLTADQLIRANVKGYGSVSSLDETLIADYVAGTITTFPVCGVTPPPPPTAITCNEATSHFSSGCKLLLHYDSDKDGKVSSMDASRARTDGMTNEEVSFILSASAAGSINTLCSGCYGAPAPPPPTPPGTETRTTSLTEENHDILVSLSGYDTLQATIKVTSTGVTCVSVVGGACGGSGLPRISTSGWTVTTYLKTGTGETDRCTWIATKDTSKVVFISEMVLAYSNLADIGFVPTASEIGQAVLMYSNLGTPASLWGC